MAITTIGTHGIGTDVIVAADIAANAVTASELADDAVDTAAIANNAVTGAKIALTSQASGDIMYYNGTDWIRLAKGTADQVLTMNDGATAAGWEDASAGTALTGSTNNTITTVTGANAIQGEANLTYDGTHVTVSSTNTPKVIIDSTSGNNGSDVTISEAANATGSLLIRFKQGAADGTAGDMWHNLGFEANADVFSLRSGDVDGSANHGLVFSVPKGTGAVLMPSQPAFTAMNTVSDPNVTGNTTSFAVVDFNAEIFDQGGDFASDTFTAPVTGRYLLTGQARLFGYTAAANEAHNKITTSNRTYVNIFQAIVGAYSEWSHPITALVDMDASDTATLSVRIRGESSNIVDIYGDSDQSDLQTFFSGYLVA